MLKVKILKIDSLQNELALVQEDSNKVSLLLKISEAYGNESLDSNLFYKKTALKISEQYTLKTRPYIVCETIKAITKVNDYNEVINFGQRYYQKFKEQNFIYEHLLIGNGIGYAHHALGERDSSFHYYNYTQTK